MTDLILKTAHSLRHPARSGAFSWSLGVLAAWRSRRRLETLDARMLDDIGVTRAQADREAQRPVWDVPAHWIDNA